LLYAVIPAKLVLAMAHSAESRNPEQIKNMTIFTMLSYDTLPHPPPNHENNTLNAHSGIHIYRKRPR